MILDRWTLSLCRENGEEPFTLYHHGNQWGNQARWPEGSMMPLYWTRTPFAVGRFDGTCHDSMYRVTSLRFRKAS